MPTAPINFLNVLAQSFCLSLTSLPITHPPPLHPYSLLFRR